MKYCIVSNRLPLSIKKTDAGLIIEKSTGGLVTGLSSYLQSLKETHLKAEFLWIGWPGAEIPDNEKDAVQQKLQDENGALPVFFSEKVMENFYEGFCNKTIWPLFHYFPSYTDYKQEYWNSYYNVNEQFCKAIISVVNSGDQVWIHDYHLMLVPKMLRELRPDLSVGFFLHIPFPTYEIFSLLPTRWRVDILQGILGADLIGFHTFDYTQYFLRCVHRILGISNEFGEILFNDRNVKADTFPMGIDYEKFNSTAAGEKCLSEQAVIRKALNNIEKIILSIDRLDYTKGILNRLFAFENFLENNIDWQSRTKLLLKIIPSRIGVDKYQNLKQQIDEQVGRINGKFGTIDWTPISYQYDFIPFEPLVALYNVADVMLVTPLRDGMNLIAKEFIASKRDKPGVLILSEMAGASKELGEAIVINPNYKEEIAAAIKSALDMPDEEQIRRNKIMRQRLKRYNVVKWAQEFLDSLESMNAREQFSMTHFDADSFVESFTNSLKMNLKTVIFLDYDGTLVPLQPVPNMAKPDKALISLLKSLSKIPNTDIVLISGREKNNVSEWFQDLDIFIVAEHGGWIKSKKGKWKPFSNDNNLWKEQLLPIFEIYVDRLPGAFIEEKGNTLAWHYRNCDPELAALRKKELIDQLVYLTANKNLQVLNGKKVIEIKPSDISKGIAGLRILKRKIYDNILAIGDDLTDEDLFNVLPERAFTVKVGKTYSCAKFYLKNYLEVNALLQILVKKSISENLPISLSGK